MDLRQLEYYVTVVEEGSILKAAQKLNLSQPPLSVAMKQLEAEFNTVLFLRGSRRIQLTDAGSQLYKRAVDILALTEGCRREIQSYAEGVSGTLRLGTVSSSAYSLLDHRLIQFAQNYPHIRYAITEGNTFEQLENLNRGLIDLAVVRTPFQGAAVHQIQLDEEPLAAIIPKSMDDFDHREIELKDLKDKPLIYYRRFEALLKEEAEKSGFLLSAYCLNDDARTSLQWAKAGLGVAIVPSSCVGMIDCANLNVRPIKNQWLITRTCLIYARQRPLSFPAQRFVEFLKQDQVKA